MPPFIKLHRVNIVATYDEHFLPGYLGRIARVQSQILTTSFIRVAREHVTD